MNELLEKLYSHQDLSFDETKLVFNDLFAGKIEPVQLGSLLTALKMNGYKPDEIGGAATAMISSALPFERNTSIDVGEIVGTGGDKLKTINISTISGIICATLGLHVAKHGNTAVSSKTGASDVLTALGYNVRTSQENTRKCLEDEGFAFFFAQVYHTGMKYAAPVRKALGTSTIFNILGPLTNPARVNYELLGCYDVNLLKTMAQALKLTGVQRGMVINGNGMDEISIFGTTKVAELFEDGSIREYELTNKDFGISGSYTQNDLLGGTPEENANTAKTILQGKGTDAHNAVIAANVSAMLHLAKKTDSFKEGFEIAMDAIRSGRGFDKLERISKITNIM
ncbi:MAG: anthranilate phosphoribosyltransferase [Succinivibrio sp.]